MNCLHLHDGEFEQVELSAVQLMNIKGTYIHAVQNGPLQYRKITDGSGFGIGGAHEGALLLYFGRTSDGVESIETEFPGNVAARFKDLDCYVFTYIGGSWWLLQSV